MRRLLLSLLLLHAIVLSVQAKKTSTFSIPATATRFAAPAFGNLNNDKVAWAGIGATVRLDAGNNATVSDAEYDAANNGLGNYSGAKLVVKRSGTAVTTDVFGFDPGSPFSFNLDRIQYNSRSFGTYTNANGVLTINLESSAILPTKQVVTDLVRAINYRNNTPAGNAVIEFALSDKEATATANVTVTSSDIYVTNTAHAAVINAADGVSFAEAFLISAAQTGTNTIRLATANNSTINLASKVMVSKNTFLTSGATITVSGNTINVASGVALTIPVGSGNLSIQSGFEGDGSLQNSSTATITLGGSNGTLGAVTFTAGTLQISDTRHIPNNGLTLNTGTTLNITATGAITIAKPIQVAGNPTISITSSTANVTFSGVISGNGNLTKTGTGTISFTANNTHAGNVTISAGILAINSSANLTTKNITLSGGRLQVAQTTTLSNPIIITSNSSIETSEDADVTLSGQISGSGLLTKIGLGTLIISGTNSNSNGLTITGGALSIASRTNLPTGSLLTLNNATLITTAAATINSAITLSGNSTINLGGDLTLSGVVSGNFNLHKIGNGILTFTGNNTFGTLSFIGTVSVGGQANLPNGAITMNSGSTLLITSNGNINNNFNLVGGNPIISNAGNVVLNGTISQASSLTGFTKAGIGTLTLAGVASYSGATEVQAGTLAVNSSLTATSGLTVNTGATLAGTGSVFATGSANTLTISNGGTLAPTGNLSINGHLNLSNGSTFRTIINNATQGSGYGSVKASGNVSLNNATLAVNHSYTTNSKHTYTLIEKTSMGAINGAFNGLEEDGTLTADGNGITLTASYLGGTGNHFTLSTPDPTLPVEFISFTAKVENSSVRLDWKTAMEKDNKSFTILRSANGIDFKAITSIASKGNSETTSSYTAYDRSPMKGTSYYKLIQTDIDGKDTELDTKPVNFSLNRNGLLTVAPNPAQNYTVVDFPTGTQRLELLEVSGKIVQKIQVTVNANQQLINLDGLPQGTYIIKCYGSYGIANGKMIKKN